MLASLGVQYGQGYLLGRPAASPQPVRPAPVRTRRSAIARRTKRAAVERAAIDPGAPTAREVASVA